MSSRSQPSRFSVAYLSTDYPLTSHTFIQTETLGLGAEGCDVLPMALNSPDDDHLLSDDDRTEAARTYYVKATPRGRIAAVVLRVAGRHPIGFTRFTWRTLRPYLGTWPRLVKRSLQLLEAMLVWDECRRRGVRSIHAHMGLASATVAWFACELGRTLDHPDWTWSMTVHGWSEFVNDDDAELARKVASASLVVAISDFTRSQLMRLAAPAHWPKIRVVRCGIDLDQFRVSDAPADPARIVMTARMAPEKGHLVLLEAMVELEHRGVSCSARLIGGGPLAETVRREVDRSGLGDRVTLVGTLPPSGVAAELAGAGVFCLPTFAEGLPVVLMEAMAVGVPVVTTYISGIPELVRDGDTGFVVPAGRADLLADALEQAIALGARRREMVTAARTAVEVHHDARRNLAALAVLLRDAHGGTPT